MKKIIYFLIVFVGICVIAMAQETYYYTGGERILLRVDSQKLVTISPRAETRPILSNGFELVDTVYDTQSHIRIYRHSEASSPQVRMLARQVNQSASAVQPCYIDRTGLELIPDGYLYIKLKSAADSLLLNQMAAQYQLEIVHQNEFMPLWHTLRQLPSSNQSAVDVTNTIYETGLFASASPSFLWNGYEISYDTEAHKQWNLYNQEYEDIDISVSSAWNYATGRGVIIAIIDGKIYPHNDLIPNMYPNGYDTHKGAYPPNYWDNSDNHATHCAGIAAAVRNNVIGIAGVAPDAKIMAIRNNLEYSPANAERLADGINWARLHNADIISCSWKCVEVEMVREAIDSALVYGRDEKGCIIVKSAGNANATTNDYSITFPGTCRGVLTIGNITEDGTLAYDSCFGDSLFAVAPGTHIWSTIRENQIDSMSGTSMATPHVAGVAALILERNPNLTANQVREIIAQNTTKVSGEAIYTETREFGSWNERYGYGLINAYEAVKNTPLITIIPITSRKEDEDLETQ